MTSNIVHLEPDPHVAVLQLLPWYLNGRLDERECRDVDEHLAGCAACRAELETERQWSALQPQGAASGDVDAGWARMRARVASEEPAAGSRTAPEITPTAPVGRGYVVAGRRGGWLGRRNPVSRGARDSWSGSAFGATPRAWALPGLLSAGLAVAIVWTIARPAVAPYHVLAAAPSLAGTAVVRFRPDATEPQIRASLEAGGARIVDGPTVTGGYVVSVPREHYQAALERLRRQPAVTLAEALEGASSP